VARADPDPASDERTTLTQFFDFLRQTMLLKAEGLTEEQARVTLTDGGLSMLTLVRHMVEVERGWFQKSFLGRDVPYQWCDDEDRDRDFHPGPDDTLAEAVELYRREIAASDAVIAAADLDQLEARQDRDGGRVNLRWILAHMIEETGRHCGHADLIRESIDGTVGE
jgi:uncharacterized damage-inducible protein DinB